MMFFMISTIFLTFSEIALLTVLLSNFISKGRSLTFQFVLQITRFLLNMTIFIAIAGGWDIPGMKISVAAGNEGLIGTLFLVIMACISFGVSLRLVYLSRKLAVEILDALPARQMEIERLYDAGQSDQSEKKYRAKILNEALEIAGVNDGLSRYVRLESLIYTAFLIFIVFTGTRSIHNIHIMVFYFIFGYLIPFGIQVGMMSYIMLRLRKFRYS